MKCPRCGLVHAPADQVCRRCEIDLKTGEPRPRVALRTDLEGKESTRASFRLEEFAQAIKQRMPGRKPLLAPAPAPVAAAAATVEPRRQHEAEPSRLKKSLSFITLKNDKGKSLPSRIKAKIQELIKGKDKPESLASISCARCTQPMSIEKIRPFNAGGPIALIALGAVLFFAGFRYPLLWITAALSLAAGVLYLRVGKTFWKCGSCGFTVPRA